MNQNMQSFFKKMLVSSLTFFKSFRRLRKGIGILILKKKKEKFLKLIIDKFGSILFLGGIICLTPFSLQAFSDDINYSRLYDSAKAAHPGQERLIRDEATLKSKAVRFSEVLEFIREHVPGGRSCFISHAFNPRVSEVAAERHLYEQNRNLFEYYDQFYRFLGVSLRLSGFDTLCDLLSDDPRLGIRGNDRAGDFCRRVGDVNHAIAVFVPYYKERYAVAGSGVRVEFDCMVARQTRDRCNLHYYAPLLLDGTLTNAIPETETPLRGRLFQRFTVQDREENRFFYDDFFALLKDYLMTDHQEIISQSRQFFDNPDMPMPRQRRASLTLEQRILELKRGMENRTKRIEGIDRYIRDFRHTMDYIFIVGPVGSGKTVLAHILAGKNLDIRRIQDRGYCLVPRTHEDHLSGFDIGHGTPAGTTFPAIWHDEHSFIVDCTGFGDPAGPVTDILNAFSIQKLFEGRKAKVVLAVNESMIRRRHEYQNLKKLLGDLVGFFREDEDLRRSLSLVVTQREDIDVRESEFESNAPGQSISSFINRELLPYFANDGYLATRYERSRALLRFFSENPHRVSSLRKAERENGPFRCEQEREALHRIIRNAEFVNSVLTLEIGRDAREFVATVVGQLNRDLVVNLSTIGSQRIANFCNTLIEGHRNPIDDLRRSFRQISSTLRNLSEIPLDEPMRFATELERFMNTDEIRGIINQIAFLKTLNDDRGLAFETREWARAFDTIRGQIDSLSRLPECRYDAQTQTMYVASVLLGTSDIQRIFEGHPRVSSVYAFAWNTVFFDSDMRNHGKSLVLVVPQWNAIATCLIDLSGVRGRDGANGAPGQDGRPGSSGQSGGHFFGRYATFEGLSHLTVDTSGGQGGNGGNGGNGADGKKGDDGDLTRYESGPLQRPNEPTEHRHGPNWREFDGISYFYKHAGTTGTPGLNGGRGGNKGFGGLSGRVLGFTPHSQRSQDGAVGQKDGTPGRAGRGGQHGRSCKGQIDRNITYRNMRKDEDRGNKIRFMCSGSEPDKVISEPGYLDRNPPSASDGLPGSGLSDVASVPSVQNPELNVEDILREYREGYEQARRDANITPFVKPFPGLEM